MTFAMGGLEQGLLVLGRVSGVILTAPLVGDRQVPAPAKITLAVLWTVILAPRAAGAPAPGTWWGLAGALALEVGLGLIIGWLLHLMLYAVQMAGSLVDIQVGFTIGNVINPQGTQVSVLGQFSWLIAMLVFLAVNGHYAIVRALASSFDSVPLGGWAASPQFAAYVVSAATGVLSAALQMAAPLLGTLFLTDVALGFLARAVPQMNVFVVGFPLKILVGLGVGFLALGLIMGTFYHGFQRSVADVVAAVGRL